MANESLFPFSFYPFSFFDLFFARKRFKIQMLGDESSGKRRFGFFFVLQVKGG